MSGPHLRDSEDSSGHTTYRAYTFDAQKDGLPSGIPPPEFRRCGLIHVSHRTIPPPIGLAQHGVAVAGLVLSRIRAA